jgi:uncharacterized membrane-anchored protein
MRSQSLATSAWALCLLLASVVSAAESPSKDAAKDSPIDRIKWQKGPSSGALGNLAQIKIPEKYIFAGGEDTKLLMETMQNPVSGRELGFFAPEKAPWFIVFEYDDTGYIRDDEKGSLDAAAMLESIRGGNEEGNKERVKRGWAKLEITGWEQPPRYDEKTNNLEWAIRAESEGRPVVNFNTRILGRGGVMRVTLVTGPEELAATLPQYRAALKNFSYNSGQKYAEYRQGDKLATYGLSALVVGGATAAAVKSGAFKWLWKFGGIAVLALLGFAKKLFGRRKTNDLPT